MFFFHICEANKGASQCVFCSRTRLIGNDNKAAEERTNEMTQKCEEFGEKRFAKLFFLEERHVRKRFGTCLFHIRFVYLCQQTQSVRETACHVAWSAWRVQASLLRL